MDGKVVRVTDPDALSRVADVLTAGGVAALPTDTLYGVASLASSTCGVGKLYELKNRDRSKPVAVCVSEVGQVERWAEVTVSHAMLSDMLPGPCTLVFHRRSCLNPNLNPGHQLVGIRIPDLKFIRDLIDVCGEPLALTSANASNAPSSLQISEFTGLWADLNIVVDAGYLDNGDLTRKGSTVIDLSVPGHYSIIRAGCAYSHYQALLTGKYGWVERPI